MDRPWSPELLAEGEDEDEDEDDDEDEDEGDDPEEDDDATDAGWALELWELAAVAECPGADSATSTANPAVSAALVPTTQRRVRLTRSSAASLLSKASGSRPRPALEFSDLFMLAQAISRQ